MSGLRICETPCTFRWGIYRGTTLLHSMSKGLLSREEYEVLWLPAYRQQQAPEPHHESAQTESA